MVTAEVASGGGGEGCPAAPWRRGGPLRWLACGAVVAVWVVPGWCRSHLSVGAPPLLAPSFFLMVATLWRRLGCKLALGANPRLCRPSPMYSAIVAGRPL